MNNLIVANIRVFNLNSFLIDSIKNDIYIERISYKKNILKCKISKSDLKKISKYYKVTIIKEYNLKSFIKKIKANYLFALSIIFSFFLFWVFKNIIIKIEIVSNNEVLAKELNKSLENYAVDRLSFKKSDDKSMPVHLLPQKLFESAVRFSGRNHAEWHSADMPLQIRFPVPSATLLPTKSAASGIPLSRWLHPILP